LTNIIDIVAAREGVGGEGIKPTDIGEEVGFHGIGIDGAGDGENSVEFRRNLARLDLED
jgi:hypothetical protein